MTSRNSKPRRFRLDILDKRNLKPSKKNMALVNLGIYYTGKHIKSEQNNNKFKIFAPTWNDTFYLPDGSYYIVDIQDYFQFIIKRHENLAKSSPVQIYPNKIKNTIVFKIKNGYNLELLSPETNRLLESTKKDVNKDKDDETHQNQNLLKLFYCIVIQSKMIIKIYQKFCLFLPRINNLDS